MHLTPLLPQDLGYINALKPNDWADIQPIHQYYLNSPYCFPIKVVENDKLLGIGTTILHGDTAWLAHIIVHPEARGRGLGRMITEALVARAHTEGRETVLLIATDLGAPVYAKVGFVVETEYLFFKELPLFMGGIDEAIVPFSEGFADAVLRLDREIAAEDRRWHLEPHLSAGFAYRAGTAVEGFYLPTWGDGLILAGNPTAGVALMQLRLTTKDHANFPLENVHARAFMEQFATHYRTAKRMRLGPARAWRPENFYNRVGGNLG
jgi:GNAT superfamily N-acetyltransferase